MTGRLLPTRTLPDRPHLDQLKRQARELLDAFRADDAAAVQEVHHHYRDAEAQRFALHEAQLVIARAYGFSSWPKLKAFVDGATIRRLVGAIQAGDLPAVRTMVAARPELVHLDVAEDDEHQALHHAVLARQPEIVRFLMQHGADARKGIWPHREATTALTIARERGEREIVRIIEQEERPRPIGQISETFRIDDAGDQEIRTAIATGDEGALRRMRSNRRLTDGRRILSQAVARNRPDVVRVLLELGLDPDETERVDGVEEVMASWGAPLRLCAIEGHLAIARQLLAAGARANTNVYAATSALYEAHTRRHAEMIVLLEHHGGRLTPTAVGELGLVEHAKRLLSVTSLHDLDAFEDSGHGVAADLLWGGIESPEIVTLALDAIDWPRHDPRWHRILENGLSFRPDSDRARKLDAFTRVLDRADPDVRSKRGATLLHDVAASRGGLLAADRVAYATRLLDRDARVDVRDDLLQSTALGWACRWGRAEMVTLLLARGADPVEANAPEWATPAAWATKMGHPEIVAMLRRSDHTTPSHG